MLAVFATCASLMACKGDAACREVCTKFGIDAASEQCTMLCTHDCEELARTFGMNVDQCKAMQRGELR